LLAVRRASTYLSCQSKKENGNSSVSWPSITLLSNIMYLVIESYPLNGKTSFEYQKSHLLASYQTPASKFTKT
jgi:hypothetical protein